MSSIKATVSAQNKFSADFLKKIADPEKNLVMSSPSISSVLPMILAGEKGSTAEQIENCLYEKSEEIMDGFKDIMLILESCNSHPQAISKCHSSAKNGFNS